MKKKTKVTIAGAAIAAAAIAGGGVAVASSDDADVPITGDALEAATGAALAHTGGGVVTGTEVGDEESMYEVEVTLDDGSQVDVQLDERFSVVGEKIDSDVTDD